MSLTEREINGLGFDPFKVMHYEQHQMQFGKSLFAGPFLDLKPPVDEVRSDMIGSVRTIILTLRNDMQKVASEADGLAADQTLTPYGRMQKLSPSIAELEAAYCNAAQFIERQEADLANTIRTAAAAPKLGAQDLVTAVTDREIRQGFAQLDPVPRDNLRAAAQAGDENDVLYALARGPLPSEDRDWAQRVLFDSFRESPDGRRYIPVWNCLHLQLQWAALELSQIKAMLDAVPYSIAGQS